MRTLQVKMTEAVETMAENHGLEVILQSEWSNTGRWLFQPPGGFDTILTVDYEFQRDYVTLRVHRPDDGTAPWGDKRRAEASDGDAIRKLLHDVEAAIQTALAVTS